MHQVETVIIGAGPYGLSIAAHLKKAKLRYQLFGVPLESWRCFMPVGMILKSEPFASNLWDPERKFTLEKFSAHRRIAYKPVGDPLSLERFLEYAEWFREEAVGDTDQARIVQIQRRDGGFLVRKSDGSELECSQVVLATGHMAFQHVPAELADLPGSVCKHSAQIREVAQYQGRDVTVIGAGQSALETAALLQEAGAVVRVIVRKNRVEWISESAQPRTLLDKVTKPEAGLGAGWESVAISELPRVFRILFPAEKRHRYVANSWGPSGARWLRKRVEGRIEIVTGARTSSATEARGRARLLLESKGAPKEIETDLVIAATGYRVDIDRVGYLDPKLAQEIKREGKAPLLSGSFETSVPGLFVVGIASAPTFGPVMRFMFGAKHSAPIVTRRLKSATKW